MSKITSKLQVTIPKAIADRFSLKPGDDIEFVAAGEVIRLESRIKVIKELSHKERLELFEQATQRQRERDQLNPRFAASDRGWRRDELYDRDHSH